MATRQLSTFRLGTHLFGIDVVQVQEVIRYQEMTPVPLAAGEIRGLINLRGQIVTAIDLRRRLGLAERPDGQLPMNVVIRSDEESVSLLVDDIADVVEPDEASFEPPPETVSRAARDLIQGAYKLEEELLLLLDTGRVLTVGA